MIGSLLQVDPKKRLSTEQILHMPVFIAKYNESVHEAFGQESKDLIGTIKVPINLSQLAERLPASQYDSDKRIVVPNTVDQIKLGMIKEEEEPAKQKKL
jgi:hypothetical protein